MLRARGLCLLVTEVETMQDAEVPSDLLVKGRRERLGLEQLLGPTSGGHRCYSLQVCAGGRWCVEALTCAR